MESPQDGTILENQGPWGNRGGGGSGNGGNRGGGNQDPDLDAVLRQAQDRFKSAFGNKPSPTDFDPRKGVFLLGVAVVALWLGSGFYRVEPGEHVVKLTFGKKTSVNMEPGLGYALPWPVQEIVKVNVGREQRMEFGGVETTARASTSLQASDNMMLTGDENIIDIDFVVLWRIADAEKYLFAIRDPETTVRKVAESTMREVIGRTLIQKALTESRGAIETTTKEAMQKTLDEYNSGILVSSVQLQKVSPPSQVVDAFDDVQRARTDKERLKNEAETYRNDIVPKARGEAQKMIQDAGAYKEAVISKAQGDAERFLSVYRAYAESKDVTQTRIYIETMEKILQGSKKIIVGDGKTSGVLPYMSLDQLKAAKGN